MARPAEDPVERFWSFVKKTSICWNWTGSKFSGGYGQFSIGGKNKRAHRFSYELHTGGIPAGSLICHTCDNTSCVNPGHLFLGTWKTNAQDMISKGRKACTAGERNGQSKITKQKADRIRRLYLKNTSAGRYSRKEYSQDKLAMKFGLSQGAVHKIITGKTWGVL